MATVAPIRIRRKETRTGKKDIYRVIVSRRDIPEVYRILEKIDKTLRSRASKPLFERMTAYADVLVVHSSRSNFRKILVPRIRHMRPCILRTPSLPGRRRMSRMTTDHPILGPK